MVTATQLSQICRAAPKHLLDRYTPRLNRAMAEFRINTPQRQAAFVAQLAHECGEFRWMAEIWGPTPQQLRYEPPSPLARKLGNTTRGDGKRFKGRGGIMITGRSNYAQCSRALFPEDPEILLRRPELLEQPTQAMRASAWFWADRGLNEWADRGQFLTITKIINGGVNGLEDRIKYWKRALAVLVPPESKTTKAED